MTTNNDKYLVSVDLADTGTDYTAENRFQIDEDGKITITQTKLTPRMTEIENNHLKCVGGIIGDIIGQRFEFRPIKYKAFRLYGTKSHFTDDSVMTCAVMDWLINGGDLDKILRKWGNHFPNAGYGKMFYKWLFDSKMGPYGSYGNGSAMRVSPVGWAANSIEECLEMARDSALPTHNHIEGIKGAQAVACAVFMAKNRKTKDEIKEFISSKFDYNLDRKINKFQGKYYFQVSCQKSVPEAIICFIEGTDYEDCIRNAVALGGDADTQADIAGAISEAYGYEISDALYNRLFDIWLPENMKNVIKDFNKKYIKQ